MTFSWRDRSTRARSQRPRTLKRSATDPRLTAALATIPRQLFVTSAAAQRDEGSGLAEVPHPELVALMLGPLELRGSERVLEVGTSPGYQTAILSQLARDVYSIGSTTARLKATEAALSQLAIGNVRSMVGDGRGGWPGAAPFDAIVVSAGVSALPMALVNQLGDGGRLVIPMGDASRQLVIRYRRRGTSLDSETLGSCLLAPLSGEQDGHGSCPWLAAVKLPSSDVE